MRCLVRRAVCLVRRAGCCVRVLSAACPCRVRHTACLSLVHGREDVRRIAGVAVGGGIERSDRRSLCCSRISLFDDQLRDAAEAAPRLIAEGFGRWSRREFARYLVMARSELMEVRSDLLALQRRRTLPGELATELLELTDHALRTTNRLRSSLPS